jgi:hypothetical protein
LPGWPLLRRSFDGRRSGVGTRRIGGSAGHNVAIRATHSPRSSTICGGAGCLSCWTIASMQSLSWLKGNNQDRLTPRRFLCAFGPAISLLTENSGLLSRVTSGTQWWDDNRGDHPSGTRYNGSSSDILESSPIFRSSLKSEIPPHVGRICYPAVRTGLLRRCCEFCELAHFLR